MDSETKLAIEVSQILDSQLGKDIRVLKAVIENQEKRIVKLEKEINEVYSYYGANK